MGKGGPGTVNSWWLNGNDRPAVGVGVFRRGKKHTGVQKAGRTRSHEALPLLLLELLLETESRKIAG